MSGQRRRIEQPILKIDTSDLTTYQGPASGATVRVLRTGAIVNTGATINASATATIQIEHPGEIRPSDNLYFISSGTLNSSSLAVSSGFPSWNGTTWDLELTNNSGSQVTLAQGDRLVLVPSDDAEVTLYEDDVSSRTVTNPITLGTDGVLVAYANEAEIDLYVTGSGLDATYYPDIRSIGDTGRVTPELFGAVGDGSTDDTSAIQHAIDFLGGLKGGGTLELGSKTYNIASALTMRSNVKIIGGGPRATVLNGASGTYYMLDASAAENCVFEEFELASQSGTVNGIDYGGEKSVFKNLYAGTDISTAIRIDDNSGTGGHSLLTCQFDGCTRALDFVTGTGVQVIGGYVNSNIRVAASGAGDLCLDSIHFGAGASLTDPSSEIKYGDNTGLTTIADLHSGFKAKGDVDLNANDVKTLSYHREDVVLASAVTVASDTTIVDLTGTASSTLATISGAVEDRVLVVNFSGVHTNLRLVHNSGAADNALILPNSADYYVNGQDVTLTFVGKDTSGIVQWVLVGYSRGPIVASASITISGGAIAATDIQKFDVTATGAALGDFVEVSYGADLDGVVLSGAVRAADTVELTFANADASSISVADSTAYVRVYKRT